MTKYNNNCLVCDAKIFYNKESTLKHIDCKFKLKDKLRIYAKLIIVKIILVLTNVEHTDNSYKDIIYFSEVKRKNEKLQTN